MTETPLTITEHYRHGHVLAYDATDHDTGHTDPRILIGTPLDLDLAAGRALLVDLTAAIDALTDRSTATTVQVTAGTATTTTGVG